MNDTLKPLIVELAGHIREAASQAKWGPKYWVGPLLLEVWARRLDAMAVEPAPATVREGLTVTATFDGLASYETKKALAKAAECASRLLGHAPIGWMLRSKSTGAAWVDEGCLWADWNDAAMQADALNIVGDEGEEPHDWEPWHIQFADEPARAWTKLDITALNEYLSGPEGQAISDFIRERTAYLEAAKKVSVGSYGAAPPAAADVQPPRQPTAFQDLMRELDEDDARKAAADARDAAQAKGYRLIRAAVLANEGDLPEWLNEALCMADSEEDFDALCLGTAGATMSVTTSPRKQNDE